MQRGHLSCSYAASSGRATACFRCRPAQGFTPPGYLSSVSLSFSRSSTETPSRGAGTAFARDFCAPQRLGQCLRIRGLRGFSRVVGDSAASGRVGCSRETLKRSPCLRVFPSAPSPRVALSPHSLRQPFSFCICQPCHSSELSLGDARLACEQSISSGGLLATRCSARAPDSPRCQHSGGGGGGGFPSFACPSPAFVPRALTPSRYLLEFRCLLSVCRRKRFLPAHAQLQRSPDLAVTPLKLVLVGRPNVGKSTLFNRLLSGTRGGPLPATSSSSYARSPRLDRAIVSPQAGTTRDRKEARAVFGGLQLTVVDTGGLEDAETTEASGLLKRMRKQARRRTR